MIPEGHTIEDIKKMIMEYELTGISKIKMTVGVRRRTLEKVQYCITAISSE